MEKRAGCWLRIFYRNIPLLLNPILQNQKSYHCFWIQKICFAQVVGVSGEFVTTEDLSGAKSAWFVSEDIQPNQIGKGDQKFNRLQVQQIGVVQNGQLQQTINTEVLVGRVLKVTSADEEVLAINGQIQGEKINASEFSTYVFTMDTGSSELL